MKRWSVLLLVLAGCGLGEERFERSAPFKPGVLKIHLAENAPGDGRRPATLPGSDAVVHLRAEPELTEAHLKTVAVWNGQNDDKTVVLMFNAEGTARLARLTAENVGKRLVFVIEDRIVMAPVIQSQINDGLAVIEGGYTKEEAEALAMRLSGS